MSLACLAAVARAGNVVAWVDASDALDAESAAASGIDLERLLWICCATRSGGSVAVSQSTTSALWNPAGRQPATASPLAGSRSSHPRTESRDMLKAVASMLQAHGGLYAAQVRRERSRVVGTPGAPNRRLEAALANGAPRYRMEQVSTQDLPDNIGDNLAVAPRCAEPLPRRQPQQHTLQRVGFDGKRSSLLHAEPSPSRWTALDRALRATDLLLQAGGFGAIVLDLGSTPAEFVWKIPLTTWFRFRAACAQAHTSLVLLTQHPCARSSAELVVRLQPGRMGVNLTVMTGAHFQAEVARDRAESSRVVPIRKPSQSERPGDWTARTVRA